MNRLRTAMAALSLIVAGFFSAGLSHSAVWLLTALGVVCGPYGTYRHEAIAAAVLAAAVAGGAVGIIGLGCAFAAGVRGGDAWFGALQRTIANIGPRRAFAVVVAVQFGAIVVLESVEQIVQLGHTLGPLTALGAPLVAAIPIYALCALAVVALLSGVARAMVGAEARARGLLLPLIRRRTGSSPAAAVVRPNPAAHHIIRPAPLALRFANRPPPSMAA